MELQTSQRSFDIRTVGDRRGRAAVVLIVLLCVAAAGFAAYWFLLRGPSGHNDSAVTLYEQLPPTDTRLVIQPNKLLDSEFVAVAMSFMGSGSGGVGQLRKNVEAEFGFTAADIEAVGIALDVEGGGGSVIIGGDVTLATGHSALAMLQGMWGMLSGSSTGPPIMTQVDGRHVVGGLGQPGADAVKHFEGPTALTETERAMIAPVDTDAALWGTYRFAEPFDVVSILDLPPIPIPGINDTGKIVAYAFSVETTDALDATCSLLLDRPAETAANAGRALLAFGSRFSGGSEKAMLDTIDIRSEGNLLIVRSVVDNKTLTNAIGGHGGGGGISPLPWLDF